MPAWFVPGADGPLGMDPLSYLDQPGVVVLCEVLLGIKEATRGRDYGARLHVLDQYGRAALNNVPAWFVNGEDPPSASESDCVH